MNPDYSELLHLLGAYKVRYLIVGGYAVMKYAEPRFTKDLDLWVENNLPNARRLRNALAAFGAPIEKYTPEDLVRPGMVHQFGIPPLRVDILSSLPGLNFHEA